MAYLHSKTAKLELTFVVPVNDRYVYENTFLSSPIFRKEKFKIKTKFNYHSASTAFNDALSEADTEIVIFTHQDMFFPESWIEELSYSLQTIEAHDRRWGVIGCYGVTRENNRYGHLYSTGLREFLGSPMAEPVPVQTLDEIILVMRKSSGLKFDENLPGFHLYGTDICQQAARKGLLSYAIDAFCIHNTDQKLWLPDEFYKAYRYLRKKYWKELPIQTSCIRISKSNYRYFQRKFADLYAKLMLRRKNHRYSEPSMLMMILEQRTYLKKRMDSTRKNVAM